MIHVFFVPGMFGSTIEYVLRNFTNKYETCPTEISTDGSMHLFSKEYHPRVPAHIELVSNLNSSSIATPIYPFSDLHLLDIINMYQQHIPSYETDHCVLLHASSLRGAELNMLFQYYKISIGKHIHLGLDIFCGDNEHWNNRHNIINWNPSYTHWSEMKQWEFREWFSLFYAQWVQEWIVSQQQVDSTFLKVDHLDVLDNFVPTLSKIIKHCGLTETDGLEEFSKLWRSKQQYIVDEFELLDSIVTRSINNSDFSWEPINVIAEAIIQQRLRALGYEIRCDGLNTFPTDSKTLYNLLEKV